MFSIYDLKGLTNDHSLTNRFIWKSILSKTNIDHIHISYITSKKKYSNKINIVNCSDTVNICVPTL